MNEPCLTILAFAMAFLTIAAGVYGLMLALEGIAWLWGLL